MMYIYKLTIFFVVNSLLIVSRPHGATASTNDGIFTENGGPINENVLEEEILEQLAKQQLERNWAEYRAEEGINQPERSSDELELDSVPADRFDNSNPRTVDDGTKPKPIYKKQGQEEFSTFVDPIPLPNYQRVAAKPSLQLPSAAKRVAITSTSGSGDYGDTVFIVVVAGCTFVGLCGVALAGFMFYRLHKQHKSAQESEYPYYGVTGPSKERTSGTTSPVNNMDAKLASSAQLYHYQHTKQQIIAMEHSACETKGNESDDSEGEGEEGDFSVYECPGLAPTGDLEVSNPLFENSSSPVTKTDPHRDPDVHHTASE